MISRTKCTMLLMGLLLAVTCQADTTNVSWMEFQSHNIGVVLVVPGTAFMSDTGQVKLSQGTNLFVLTKKAESTQLSLKGQEAIAPESLNREQLDAMSEETRSVLPDMENPTAPLICYIDWPQDEVVSYKIDFEAIFNDDVEGTEFSHDNVGREITGTITERGAYLSPSSYYYPQGSEELCSFSLTAIIPLDWESICDGNLVSSIAGFADTVLDSSGKALGVNTQSWTNPYLSEGCMFFAAPFVVDSAMAGDVAVYCYFYEEDTSLFADYTPAAAEYVNMYVDLIGEYPFERFTVVENFFPTGYGMPAWTLLGQRVIRMPFIVRTSLGHEILHNWWGNSVYVDYDKGNWCEGFTVYGADYRYKLMKSPADARNYRKNILKRYFSYVTEENDFAVRDFISRNNPVTQTIGYGKAMMIVHMIENEIGTEQFFETWKQVYQDYRGTKIDWDMWISSFAKNTSVSLDHIIPQWIDRVGAPMLALELTGVTAQDDGISDMITFAISQTQDDTYRLKIPVRLEGTEAPFDTFVILDEVSQSYEMIVPSGMLTIEVDPDYNLFRRLYPDEVEPVISAIFGAENRRFISSNTDSVALDKQRTLCVNMEGGDSITLIASAQLDSMSDASIAPVLFNPTELPDYLKTKVTLSPDSISIDGATYPREGHTFVLTAKDHDGFERCMVILSRDWQSLPRIGQLLTHYNKYSYLGFKGPRNMAKGQWTVTESPLRISLTQ